MSWFDEKVVPYLKEGANVEAIRAEYETEVQKAAIEAVPGVIQNKEEILNEKKELQKQFNEFKERYSSFEDGEITFEMFSQMQSELESLKASSGGGDEALREQYELGKKAAEDLLNPKLSLMEDKLAQAGEDLKTANGKYQNFRARNEVRKAISEANIDYDDFWFEGLMNRSAVNYNSDNDSIGIEIPYGDKGNISLSDWIGLYVESDEGKKRVKAPLNNGGGANGGRGSDGGRMTMQEIEALPTRAERLAAMEANGY